MKNTRHLIIGLSALLLAVACSPSRYTSSSFNVASVPEYAFVQPYSYIVLYGDDGKGFYNAESSAIATKAVSNIINSERFPFSDMIPADYDGLVLAIDKDITDEKADNIDNAGNALPVIDLYADILTTSKGVKQTADDFYFVRVSDLLEKFEEK